jgi:hypothetical protein
MQNAQRTTNSAQTSQQRAVSLVLTFAFCVLSFAFPTACGNPRKDPPPANIEKPMEAPVPAARLAIRAKQGQTIRVERTLKVREQTKNDIVVLEAIETTQNTNTLVDELGRALIVTRKYEQSLTRLGSEGGRIDETKNPLHGITLELRRDAGGMATATVVDGKADVGNQKFLIDGFDAALLPQGEVREGDRWQVDNYDLAREGGLNSMIAAQGFKVEKNDLSVRVSELTTKRATLELDWRLTGSFDKTPAVLAFTGSLDFDREQELITRFKLDGGRQAEKGFTRQITITVIRSRS